MLEDCVHSHPCQTCNVCNTSFISRTKLFEHINETGHARAGEKTDNSNGGKKGKRKGAVSVSGRVEY